MCLLVQLYQSTCIGSHFLLCNEHLLRAVDDEISAGVQGTLVKLREIAVCQPVEQAVRGSQHDRDLAHKGLLVLGLYGVLPISDHGLGDVYIEWCRVPASQGIGVICDVLRLN